MQRTLDIARFGEELRGVEVRVAGLDGELSVPGDAGRLEQVLLNLLLNAGRAMGGRGHIEVSAAVDEPGWVALTVEDEGPGIAPEDLHRVFDPFFTKSGGTGLGLAVSYGIVRSHGGSLHVANRENGGARFVVRLPLSSAARLPPPRSKHEALRTAS